MEWIPVLVIAVLALVIIVRNIYVVQQSRAYVVERLGAFSNVWTVGSQEVRVGYEYILKTSEFELTGIISDMEADNG